MDDTSPAFDQDHRDPMGALAELAKIAVDGQPPEQTLRRVTELAKQTLVDVQEVSLTLIEHGHPRTVVFTGPLAVTLDERQYELGFGPCLDAAKTGQTIIVACDDDKSPYREFGAVALRAGVRHTVSLGLPVAQRTIGALNTYSTAQAPISGAFLEQAGMFAGYAAVTVANVASYANAVNEGVHLRRAMESRAVIEQAKGILMARDRCSPEEAFEILKRISQSHNVKLREVAGAIVDAAGKE